MGAAFEASQDKQSLLDALGRENLELYVRGKNIGVIDHESGKKHRLKTLDLEMADRIAIRMSGEDQVKDEAQEIEPEIDKDRAQKADSSGPDPMEPNGERAGRGEQDVAGEKEKAIAFAAQTLCLPMNPFVTDEEIAEVVKAVKSFFA